MRVTFTSVNGKLDSEGRVSGFSIHDEKGQAVPLIYRAVSSWFVEGWIRSQEKP